MKELREYLANIPNSRLRRLIGQTVCDAIVDYNIYLENIKVDYVEVLMNKFGKAILFNKEVFKNLIIFLDDTLITEIADKNNIPIVNIEQVRETISNKQFGYKNIAFSSSVLHVLELEKEKYFPASNEIIETFDPLLIPDYKLHTYQKNIKDLVIQKLLNPSFTDKMLIHMPTGAGKTKTAMEIVSDFLRCRSVLGGFDNSGFIIWLAHSQELCDQALESFQNTWKLRGDYPLSIYKIYGDNEYPKEILSSERALVFVGFQKFNAMISSSNPVQQAIKNRILEKVRLVIVDEAHKSLAETYEKSISLLTQNAAGIQLVGLTATPGRSDNQGNGDTNHLAYFYNSTKIGLVDEFGVPIPNPIKYLQDLDILAEIDRQPLFSDYEIKLTDKKLKELKLYGDDKLQEILNDLSKNPARNKLIVDKIKELNDQGESTLIFACNVEHCIILQTLLKAMNLESASILSSTTKEDREAAIKRFKSGELKILLNYGVLTTGFDAPNLKALIIARPTTSIVLYCQMVGRALRGPLNGGNKVNKLIDIKDNFTFGDESFMFNFYDNIWNY